MTPEDIEFVRKQFQFLRLLTLLVEAEARGDKAEFQREHIMNGRADLAWCCRCDGSDPRHAWTDSDWQKAVRERWGLEC